MTTAFRALVMLSVLVGLPAAWIYYGPLPPEAQRIVDRFVAVAKDAIGWDKPAPLTSDQPEIEYVTPSTAAFPIAAALVPASEPVYSPPTDPAEPASPPAVADRPASLNEQVEPLLEQLRQLGAVEYVLERWGDRFYRFHCDMPLAGNPELTEQFEAIAADPQESIQQVVAQVASWQLARQGERLTR